MSEQLATDQRVRSAGATSRKLYRKAMEHKFGKDWRERVAKCGHNRIIDDVCQDCGRRAT